MINLESKEKNIFLMAGWTIAAAISVIGWTELVTSPVTATSSIVFAPAATDVDTNLRSIPNVSLNLGTPFLIQNDTETGANVININGSRVIEGSFNGSGEVNDIGYTDNGTVKVVINGDGTVRANGIFDIIPSINTGEGEKARITFEGIGQRSVQNIVTNGVYYFSTNSTGKLAFLNDKIAVFRNIQEGRNSPLISTAWELK
jgi:hypothetical protein